MSTQDSLKLDPDDIEARGIFTIGDTIVSRIGVLLSIYFLEGWRRDKRQGLLAILEDYLSRFGENVTHYQKPDGRRLTRWDGNSPPAAYRSLGDIGETDEFHYHMVNRNPKQQNDPSLWRITAFGFARQNINRHLSGLKVHIPPSYVFANPDVFVTLVSDWCSRLDAVHGSGGLGVLTVPGEEITWRPCHWPFLQRYPALEYDAMGSYWAQVSRAGYEKPRSSNWLTILGNSNVRALGGVENIRSQLLPSMALVSGDYGIMIRTGRLPVLGGGEANDIPEAYCVAARIIQPIRFEAYEYSVIKVPENLKGLEETLKWIRRFD